MIVYDAESLDNDLVRLRELIRRQQLFLIVIDLPGHNLTNHHLNIISRLNHAIRHRISIVST